MVVKKVSDIVYKAKADTSINNAPKPPKGIISFSGMKWIARGATQDEPTSGNTDNKDMDNHDSSENK